VAIGVAGNRLAGGRHVLAEPLIAQLTSGARPDVSQFRSLVGNKAQLAFWLTITWTLAAVVEELAYRGWILHRCAELGQFSRSAWGRPAVFIAPVRRGSRLPGAVRNDRNRPHGRRVRRTYLATGRNLWAAMIAHGTLDTVGFAMMCGGSIQGSKLLR
jgi:membrane protease YdiL (CAAX protease family)